MCTYDVFTDVFPDGRTTKYHRPTLCKHSRNNQPCSNTLTYEHPARAATSVPGPCVFPPTAPITPRDTPRPGSSSRESGNESDRSRQSSSKRTKRTVYIDGKKVVEVPDKPRAKANTSERIVIVDAPPTARTPPQVFTFPHTAPPSPSAGHSPHQPPQQLFPGGINIMPQPRLSPTSAAFPHAHSYTQGFATPYGPPPPVNAHRPIIVDERHRPETHHTSSRKDRESKEARRERREKRHTRAGSSTSTSSVESERRRRREAEAALRETRAELEAQVRKQRIAERIRLANAEIAARQPVPLAREQPRVSTTASAAMPKAPAPPSPLKRSATGFFPAPAPAPVHRSSEAERIERELSEAVRRLELATRAKRERERAEETARERRRLEDAEREGRRDREAEEARLRERMMPRRRFTVGPGSRRPKTMYEEGVYRWE